MNTNSGEVHSPRSTVLAAWRLPIADWGLLRGRASTQREGPSGADFIFQISNFKGGHRPSVTSFCFEDEDEDEDDPPSLTSARQGRQWGQSKWVKVCRAKNCYFLADPQNAFKGF
jgi:hypothetical protein